MKDVIEFCKGEIDKISPTIKELLDKHGCKSTMELMRKEDLPEEDVRTAIKLINSRNSFITVVNNLNHRYTEGIFPGDADVDSKRRAIFSVASHVLEVSSQKGRVPWEKMDGCPTDRIVENVGQCIMANELEMAVLGLVYAIYQREFQQTNRADKKLEEVFGPIAGEPTFLPVANNKDNSNDEDDLGPDCA